MKHVSRFLSTLFLLSICFSSLSFADGEREAARLSKDFQSQFVQMESALKSANLVPSSQSFTVLRDTHRYFSQDTSKVYLQLSLTVQNIADDGIKPTVRKSLYKILNNVNQNLRALVNDDECAGIMIQYIATSAQASTKIENVAEVAALCISKYEMARFLSDNLSLTDLLNQPTSLFIRNGKPQSASALL